MPEAPVKKSKHDAQTSAYGSFDKPAKDSDTESDNASVKLSTRRKAFPNTELPTSVYKTEPSARSIQKQKTLDLEHNKSSHPLSHRL